MAAPRCIWPCHRPTPENQCGFDVPRAAQGNGRVHILITVNGFSSCLWEPLSGLIRPKASASSSLDGSKDAFVHISAVERAGLNHLTEGQKIQFDLVSDQRSGKLSAANLKTVV